MGAIVPFRKSSGSGPRARALGREARKSLSAATLQQSEALRSARQEIAEAWRLRVESAAIKQGYEERRARIELLLAGMDGVERA
jgi:hypothetical protein